MKGIFAQSSDEAVSYVNAPLLAEGHGVSLREVKTAQSPDHLSMITVRSSEHSVAGTLVAGDSSKPQIVSVDDHSVEVSPTEFMLVVRNDDRPGMIGVVGTAVGAAGVSIVNMAVGQTQGGGTAMMVLALDRPLGAEVVEELRASDGIQAVSPVNVI